MLKWTNYLVFITLLLFGCSKKETNKDTNWTYQVSKLKQGYLDLFLKLNTDSNESIDLLNTRIIAFTTTPVSANFLSTKDSWLNAFEQFTYLGPFRSSTGSVANPYFLGNNEFDLHALNEAYIDYTSSNPTSGIIYDEINYANIAPDELLLWNQLGSPQNLTTGFHVIEFLVWGEDLSSSTAGQRVHQDYVGTDVFVTRRKQFLKSASLNLVHEKDLVSLDQNFSNGFLAMSSSASFEYMFSGLLEFIEKDFAEESILIPYTSQSQNDEISRFSDNSLTDLKNKFHAIELFLDPRDLLTSNSNYYFIDFIKEVDEATYTTVLEQMSAISADLNSITVDFDVAIASSAQRPKVYKLYQDVLALHATLKSFSSLVLD